MMELGYKFFIVENHFHWLFYIQYKIHDSFSMLRMVEDFHFSGTQYYYAILKLWSRLFESF